MQKGAVPAPVKRARDRETWAVGVGLASAAGFAGWSALQARNDYWAWLLPAGLSICLTGTLLMRLAIIRERAHDIVACTRFLIVVGLAVVGLLAGSAPIFSVRLLMGLLGPSILLYFAQQVLRLQEETEVLKRQADALEVAVRILEGVKRLLEMQTAQSSADAAVMPRLLDLEQRSRRRSPRVAGRRRMRGRSPR